MIVKLHDGTEGRLMARLRIDESDPDRRCGEIVIVGTHPHDHRRIVCWEDDEYRHEDVARPRLDAAIMWAGLCWEDPPLLHAWRHHDLDLSPWVRDRIERAGSLPFVPGFLPPLPSEIAPITSRVGRRGPGWSE